MRFLRFAIPLFCAAGAAALADAGPARLWPVPLAPAVSSNFCEYRDGRFHAGLDVRTYGREGVACRAVGDGWVSRMRASSRGYGKALHVMLDDGGEALYGHLAEFAPALEDTLAAAQRAAGRYNVDVWLAREGYRVRRGDVIAYSGATGTVAPHLHFETRDGDVAVNPFLTGFAIEDREPPAFSRVAFVPLAAASSIDGARYPLELTPRRTGPGRYAIDDTLRFSGEVGVAATVIDRLNRASGRLAPYEMQVWADGEMIAQVVLGRFAFTESGEVDLLYNAGANRVRGVTLFELYRRDGESIAGRAFVRGGSLTPGAVPGRAHTGRVVARDVAGNSAEIAFTYVEAVPADGGSRRTARSRAPNLACDLDGAFFLDGFGIVPVPVPGHSVRERAGNADAPGDTLALRADELAGRITPLTGVVGGDTATVYVTGLRRGVAGAAAFPALGVSLGVGPDALYGDALVYATRAVTSRARATSGLSLRSDPVRVGPAGWVLKRPVSVHLDHAGAGEHDAVYRWDERHGGWAFIESKRDSTGFTAMSGRPGVFAVVRDDTPPWLGAPQLAWPASYATGKPVAEIRVPVEDRGSGIDDARIEVTVAGAVRYARWDFGKKKIIVALRGESIIGPQPVHVVVFDRAGNRSEIDATIQFEAR
ncbi:MAG TPA: M23 family metallopeptidase [Candidatus Krumholzibacteria bacterium]|nr:M23 family metallopeptidase [Candidatus Krumholzibacteria bacterium]